MGYFSNELLYYKKLYFLFKQYGFLSDNIESKDMRTILKNMRQGNFQKYIMKNVCSTFNVQWINLLALTI